MFEYKYTWPTIINVINNHNSYNKLLINTCQLFNKILNSKDFIDNDIINKNMYDKLMSIIKQHLHGHNIIINNDTINDNIEEVADIIFFINNDKLFNNDNNAANINAIHILNSITKKYNTQINEAANNIAINNIKIIKMKFSTDKICKIIMNNNNNIELTQKCFTFKDIDTAHNFNIFYNQTLTNYMQTQNYKDMRITEIRNHCNSEITKINADNNAIINNIMMISTDVLISNTIRIKVNDLANSITNDKHNTLNNKSNNNNNNNCNNNNNNNNNTIPMDTNDNNTDKIINDHIPNINTNTVNNTTKRKLNIILANNNDDTNDNIPSEYKRFKKTEDRIVRLRPNNKPGLYTRKANRNNNSNLFKKL